MNGIWDITLFLLHINIIFIFISVFICILKQLTLGESSRRLFRDTTTIFKLSYFMVYKFLSYK